MDPNETLKELRSCIKEARLAKTQGDTQMLIAKAIQHFEDLDEWLSRGGALPSDPTGKP